MGVWGIQTRRSFPAPFGPGYDGRARAVDQLDLRYPLFGAIIGALVGAIYHRRLRRTARAAVDKAPDAARQAEQARRVASFVERAARTMVTYSRMVDAANAGDGPELERLFRGLREDEAQEQLAGLDVDDRAVREAARDFFRLHAEIAAKVERRLAAGQTVQVGGELRLRAADLGRSVEALNRAASSLSSSPGRERSKAR